MPPQQYPVQRMKTYVLASCDFGDWGQAIHVAVAHPLSIGSPHRLAKPHRVDVTCTQCRPQISSIDLSRCIDVHSCLIIPRVLLLLLKNIQNICILTSGRPPKLLLHMSVYLRMIGFKIPHISLGSPFNRLIC